MARRLLLLVSGVVALLACTHESLVLGPGGGTPTPTLTPPLTPTPSPIPCSGPGSICGFGFDRNGDGSNALLARFVGATGITSDAAGNVYVADSGGARIRMIAPDGTITTVVGTGLHNAPNTTGVDPEAANLDMPSSVAWAAGRLYWADWDDNVVYSVGTASGLIVSVAGGGGGFGGGNNNGAVPTAIHLNLAGTGQISAGPEPGELLIPDPDFGRLRVANVGTASMVVGGITIPRNEIWTVAGVGGAGGGPSMNGSPAIDAYLDSPNHAVALADGTVFIADTNHNSIRRVYPTGIIEGATAGGYGENHDGGPASTGQLESPAGVAVDGSALVTCDQQDNVCKVVDLDTTKALTFAGEPVPIGAGDIGLVMGTYHHQPFGPALEPVETDPLQLPLNLGWSAPVLLPNGNLVVLDQVGLLRQVDSGSGQASVLAGLGTDTPSQSLLGVGAVLVDGSGAVLVASQYSLRLVRLHADGTREVVAGNGSSTSGGDGGPLLSAGFFGQSLSRMGAGTVLVSDSLDHVLREVDTVGGAISTLAGKAGSTRGGNDNGGPPGAALFADDGPYSSAVDSAGNIFILDGNQVRAINRGASPLTIGPNLTIAPDTIGLVASSAGSYGFLGDGLASTAAQFQLSAGGLPSGIAVNGSTIYVADTGNNRIRAIDRGTGLISTFAGTGNYNFSGTGGPASAAELGNPRTLVLAGNTLYWTEDGAVRACDTGGANVTLVAGDGNIGDYGDGADASQAEVQAFAIDVDAKGTVYIAGGGRVRMVLP